MNGMSEKEDRDERNDEALDAMKRLTATVHDTDANAITTHQIEGDIESDAWTLIKVVQQAIRYAEYHVPYDAARDRLFLKQR